jgi:hypothetical protein
MVLHPDMTRRSVLAGLLSTTASGAFAAEQGKPPSFQTAERSSRSFGRPGSRHRLVLEAHDVTASELTVDRYFEHREVACMSVNLKPGSDRPDVLRA